MRPDRLDQEGAAFPEARVREAEAAGEAAAVGSNKSIIRRGAGAMECLSSLPAPLFCLLRMRSDAVPTA